MRLTARLVASVVAILAALVAIDGYLEYRHERALIRDAMSRDARVMGRAMGVMLADVWRTGGMERALRLIDDANRGESDLRVRWVWLDAERGDALAPAVASGADLSASLKTGALIEAATDVEARLYAYYPVRTVENRPGALELSQSGAALSQRAAAILRWSVTQLIALFLVAALTIYIIGVRLIGRPLRKLTRKIVRVGDGDLSGPLVLRGANELTQLAGGLNTMCERLSASQARIAEETAAKIAAIDQARHADRLKTVGQLASGVAHELGTPLNVVGGRAALIAENKLDAAQVVESAKIIGAQADRMTGIIRELLVFARRSSSDKERVDVEQTARQCLAMVQSVANQKNVTVDLSFGAGGPALTECNPSALQQVLTNLVINAIQASPSGSTVQVEIGTELAVCPNDQEGRERPCVRVDVRDTGGGIPEDQLPHVFEPFFTTKEVGEGTGLGLSIVHGILHDHGGWITVASKPAEGSCFTFYLPASKT